MEKSEFGFGFEYAQQEKTGPVDIDKILTGTVSIPDSDYVGMKRAGIENPDPRKYWESYNSFFE